MNHLASPSHNGHKMRPVSRSAMISTLVVSLGLLGSAAPARAGLTINATFDSSISGLSGAAAIEGSINAAIADIEANVSSTKNLTVAIKFQNMAGGLGESTSGIYTVTYYDYYNALKAVATSPAQLAAIASLGAAPTSESSGNPLNGSTQVSITAPEGRNLGFNTPGVVSSGGTFDTVIGLNLSITSPPNPLGGNYGLQSTATHELDEALGIGGPGSTIGRGGSAVGDLDLYRYSAPGVRSYTTSSSATSYFSIDGGNTVLSYFNQLAGADYADWASFPIPVGYGPQVQDAFGEPGTDPRLGVNELAAFSAIGYSLVPNSVPEPSSFVMVAIGLAVTGWKFRPRKSAKTPTAA